MRLQAWFCAWGLLFTSGCAGPAQDTKLASTRETMCRHCNCLMPSGVDPDAACPVCNCGRKAHRCVRGQ